MSAIVRFLDGLNEELRYVMPDSERERTIDELRAHLIDSAAEFAMQGETDPEALAVASFGDRRQATDGMEASHSKRGLTLCERRALALAGVAVALPVLADLAMDFSSWLTGSDSATYLIGIPMAGFSFAFAVRCVKVKRILAIPLLGMVLAGFIVSTVFGGFSQSADPNGYGTRVRGTAYKRMQGLQNDSLPRNRAILTQIDEGRAAFAGSPYTDAVAAYRVADGYLAPELSPEWAAIWKDDPRASRYLVDGLKLSPRRTFAEASGVWTRDGLMCSDMARGAIDGDLKEIEELKRVVASPWIDSVRSQWQVKVSAAISGFVALLVLNAFGSAAGVIARGRRRRKAA